jgi:hypothetical protein
MPTTTHAPLLALKAKLFPGFADSSRLSTLEARRDDARGMDARVECTGPARSTVADHRSRLPMRRVVRRP